MSQYVIYFKGTLVGYCLGCIFFCVSVKYSVYTFCILSCMVLFNDLFINLWVFCLYVCTISTLCMPNIYRGQKRASHTLKLLRVKEGCQYTGNWTGTVEIQQALLTIEPSLYPYHLFLSSCPKKYFLWKWVCFCWILCLSLVHMGLGL